MNSHTGRAGREQRDRQASLDEQPPGVGAQHDRAAADPVGQHSAAEHEHHLRHDGGGEDQAQVSRGSAAAQHREDQGHGGHGRAQQRGRIAAEEEAEVGRNPGSVSTPSRPVRYLLRRDRRGDFLF